MTTAGGAGTGLSGPKGPQAPPEESASQSAEIGAPARLPSEAETQAGRSASRWHLPVVLVLTAVALSPVAAVVLQRAGHPYLPAADQGIFDMRVRDVWSFSANTPLVGPYSRFGWDHPGPIVYYVLALFSGIFGEAAWATLVGAALLQGVAIAWASRLAWKTGGLRRVVPWLAVASLAYVATGPWILQQAWDPHIDFPFFVLFLLYTWVVSCGDGRRLVGLVIVASFLAQTHIGYVPLVAVLGAWALVRLWLTRRRAAAPEASTAAQPVSAPGATARLNRIGAAAALVLVWLPALVLDPILHPPGNVVHLVKFYFGHGGVQGALLGWRAGAGYIAAEFKWLPPWLGGNDTVDPLTGRSSPASLAWLLIPIALLGGTFAIARARRRADLSRLVELLALSLVIGVVALALLRGEPIPYLFYWRIVLGASIVVLCVWVLAETLPAKWPLVRNGVECLLAVAIGAASLTFASDVASQRGPVSPMAPVAHSILTQLVRAGALRRPILLRTWGSVLAGLDGAIIDQLTRERAHVFVDPYLGYQFGQGRTATVRQVASVWYIMEQSQAFSLVSAYPDAHVVAESHPLDATDQRTLISLQRTVAAELTQDGRTDLVQYLGNPLVAFIVPRLLNVPKDQVNALARLDQRVQRAVCLCGVVAFPPTHVPAALSPSG